MLKTNFENLFGEKIVKNVIFESKNKIRYDKAQLT